MPGSGSGCQGSAEMIWYKIPWGIVNHRPLDSNSSPLWWFQLWPFRIAMNEGGRFAVFNLYIGGEFKFFIYLYIGGYRVHYLR